MKKSSTFDSAVFAGGGNRCFWQAGFWSVACPALNIAPKRVACVSAGAAVACLIFSNTFEKALGYLKSITAENKRNIYLSNLFNKKPIFPHAEIYRSAILHIVDKKVLARLKKGPEIYVLMTRPPSWLGPRLATITGISLYSLEKMINNSVHPRYSSKIGFSPEITTIKECKTPDELADVIISSSCTPPFTPLMYYKNRPALDGGLVDNVPVSALNKNEGKTIILLTRQYPDNKIPKIKNRIYVQPSIPIAIKKWDYTNPEGLQDAFDLGRRDGEKFVSNFRERGF